MKTEQQLSLYINKSSGSCRKCKEKNLWYYIWETFDESHADYHYCCKSCHYDFWVDGPDY